MLSDPRLSPLFADPLAFPDKGQTMILSCEYDYLGPEGRDTAKKLQEAGRDPVWVWLEGLGHRFDVMCQEGSEEA